ncbi:hypothetical protein [Nocardia huaxiensis]|nr:hypothetical protein [Nocardia huaxiensis]UFS97671.1 hypothetical protein LPY97_07145 [Nocardia huaxiensis]
MVAKLVAEHGISVRLSESVYGGRSSRGADPSGVITDFGAREHSADDR